MAQLVDLVEQYEALRNSKKKLLDERRRVTLDINAKLKELTQEQAHVESQLVEQMDDDIHSFEHNGIRYVREAIEIERKETVTPVALMSHIDEHNDAESVCRSIFGEDIASTVKHIIKANPTAKPERSARKKRSRVTHNALPDEFL